MAAFYPRARRISIPIIDNRGVQDFVYRAQICVFIRGNVNVFQSYMQFFFLIGYANICQGPGKTQAYFALARPLGEERTVWDPYTQTQTDKLEMVQRLTARPVSPPQCF